MKSKRLTAPCHIATYHVFLRVLALLMVLEGFGSTFGLFEDGTTLYARSAAANPSVARSYMAKQRYDEAINILRQYLRRNPKDYSAWNQMGACYYHTGLPKRALRFLKNVEKYTTQKSYNYYYQGLSYLSAEDTKQATTYFSYAASRYVDEYASRSTFELTVLEYNAKRKPQAYHWGSMYMQRYPTGVYRSQVTKILNALSQGVWLDNITGSPKPDTEAALYKYNKFSLTDKPHFWFLQAGSDYTSLSGQEPSQNGEIKARTTEQIAIITSAGIGVGPWKKGQTTTSGGYNYRQYWYSDQERIQAYTEDFTDLEYFPFRGDLLERRHQIYGDFRRDFGGQFYFGVYGRYELARMGSSFFPGPDDSELRRVIKISDTQLLIPWIGASYFDNFRTLAYLYLRKQINEDSPLHSNKTFDLGLSGETPVLSLGISHTMEFPEKQVEVNIDLFRYEFIYNDYWLDYKREGFIIGAEHQLLPSWYVSGLIGLYRDEYVLPRIKSGSCGAAVSTTTEAAGGSPPRFCARIDTGTLLQAGIYWNWTSFHRFSADIQFVENRNAEQQEFEESKMSLQLRFSMAFPSVRRVLRMVDRYADNAFTKEAE